MSNPVLRIVVVLVVQLSLDIPKVLLSDFLLLIVGLFGHLLLGDGVGNHGGAVQVDHVVCACHLMIRVYVYQDSLCWSSR